ncbi:MAG: PKD domain-containing protein [Bacteroidia bacterium]|nr:PKD domain-containing protein [Bacteroidia bacterium]MDW8157410.1 PKD domain-containing protein [Bacteroidia bacterium]
MYIAFFIISSSNGLLLRGQYFPILQDQRFYGTSAIDRPKRIIKGPKGSYLIAGAIPDNWGSYDGYIACIEVESGKVRWSRQLGGKGYDEVRDIQLSEDQSSILFAGVTGTALRHTELGDSQFFADYWVGKLTVSGEVIWTKAIGGSRQDQAFSVAPAPFDGLYVVGSSWSKDGEIRDTTKAQNNLWFLGLNASGEIVSNLILGGNGHDWGNTCAVAPDGSIVIAGVTNSVELDNSKSKHNGDVWLVKISPKGKVEWIKVIKEAYEDYIHRIIINKYGIIYAVGSCFTLTKSKQFWFLKLDAEGNVLQNIKIGGNGFEEFTSIIECQNGGFLASGYSVYNNLESSYIKGQKDFWLIRLNENGQIIWQQTYGGPDNEMGIDLIELKEGEYLALGVKNNTFEGQARQDDFWVIRIKELPCKSISCSFTTNASPEGDAIGTPLRFYNRSKFGEAWLWEFGDGTTSTERNPVKAYSKAGIYTPKLTAIINENCRESYSLPTPIIIK